jgi:hypothetical protein
MVGEIQQVILIKLQVYLRNPSKQTRHDLDEAIGDFEEAMDVAMNQRYVRVANG